MLKKFIIFLFAIGFSQIIIAQPKSVNGAPPKQLTHAEEVMLKAKNGKSFDVRRNCIRGDNLFSYKGQELYVPSHPYFKTQRYQQFKDPCVTGANPDYYGTLFYHWDINEGYSGTDPKYVVGRTFVVDRISQSTDDADEFIFEMHDKSTHERISYEYSTASDWHRHPNYNVYNSTFPFLVMDHYNYLKRKYIGKKMVMACKCSCEPSDYEHHIYLRDTKNGLVDATFTEDYATFVVKDIIWEESKGMLCFVIDDGEGHSYLTPIESTYNELDYSLGIGKNFFVRDWESCVGKYGIEEMTHVMRGNIHIGMDSALVRLSAGCPQEARFAKKSDGLEWLYWKKDVMIVFDDNGKVKDIVEGVPSEEAEVAVAAVAIGIGALSFGVWLFRCISFPFRLIGKLFAFLGF